MTDKRWNNDIAYVFSIQRAVLRIYGLWPLQTKTVFTKIRWGFSIIAQFMILPWAIMDFWSQATITSNIECIIYITSSSLGVIRGLCINANQKRLGINIKAAIEDWLSANKESKKIMKKHAVKSKILTLTLLYSLIGCLGCYVAIIIVNIVNQVYFTDPNSVDANTTNWVFMVPSGPLSSSLTGSQYAIVVTIQFVQVCVLAFLLCITDCLFFNVTIHLTGQLEILKNQFEVFANERNIEANYRKKFISLVNKHSDLTKLYQNLEGSFHILLLFQLVVTTIMLALTGFRLNIFLYEKNYAEAIKSIIVLNYLLMQAMLYSYGGEFLQRESEDIFYALYTTSWFTLPLAVMKDLYFAMMRSSIPFRLTGGKFFFVNRETMMHIFRTVLSYISVLRIALRKSNVYG